MFTNGLFSGKTALVTGGGSGIGFSISEHLLRLGAKVYIASRKEEKLQAAVEKLGAYGPCEYIVCDIRDTEQVKQMAFRIKDAEGRLDLLVNNAGGQFPSPAEDISEKGWLAVINNNLNGTWFVTQMMARTFFIPQRSGNLINIIVNVFRGVPGMAHTGAARAGVDNLTKTLAIEWMKYNIRINAIAPGIIQSSGLDQYPPELVRGIEDTIPMKRLGTTDEIAWTALFLASPMAAYITGETIYVDGGQRLYGQQYAI
ncbi:MAG: putative 2,4-dienoyl-CoA reductase [Haliscomenobacter sp.]|jgi:citronellol/citronellal dehydrogenase|nr:putative 2,4-dienoyl-CoA reductase [Haliscomenobacter sp.]